MITKPRARITREPATVAAPAVGTGVGLALVGMTPPVELIVPFEIGELIDATEVGDGTEVLVSASPVVVLVSTALVEEATVEEAVSLVEDAAAELLLLPDPTESQNLLTAGSTWFVATSRPQAPITQLLAAVVRVSLFLPMYCQ